MTLPPVLRIGVLHSTTGTMALNETSLRDVLLMEVARVNGEGGVLGRPLEAVVLDPGSNWPAYRDMARAMIHEHGVAAIFGCWTSVSRKIVLPVVEEADSLLFYPVQYEGEEQSRNIFYLGAAPNQQAIPAIEYLMSPAAGAFTRFFFLGTDYVYPRTTNRILRAFLKAKGLNIANFPEHYVPFGHGGWDEVMEALRQFAARGRGAVISTLNGDSNLSFYRALRQAGFRAETLPVMAFSVSEAELESLAPEDVVGHYACWTYFMSHPSPENAAFLAAWRRYAGAGRPVYDPMEAAAVGFRMWCRALGEAGSTETRLVRQFMYGQTATSLSGGCYRMAVNHHLEKTPMVGRATPERQFTVVWQAHRPVPGDPWAAASIIADATATAAQRDLLDALPTPLIVLDGEGEVRYRSASTHDYFGPEIGAEQMPTIRRVTRELDQPTDGRDSTALPEIAIRDPAGRLRHMTVASRRMVFAGEDAHLLSLAEVTYIREIEERLRVLNAELRRLATTDSLTGISNRFHFLEAVQRELGRMQRHRRPAAMIMLDIDHFKKLNDVYGHDAGDKALVEAAALVRRLLRGHDLFGRLGGDEFAGFLPETDIEAAFAICERLRASIADLRLAVGGAALNFTSSIGVTPVSPDGDTPEFALKRADAGLYAAKIAGRDRVMRG